VLRHPVGWAFLPLLPLALFDLVLLASGMTLLLSAANVYLRDIQHFVELALLAWFWLTPIVYLYSQLTKHFGGRNLPLLNPITPSVLTFQRALFGLFGNPPVIDPTIGEGWYLRNLLLLALAAGALFVVAMQVFGRLEGNLAEEL
jgi:ABC-2 type transport system permease protein